MTEISKQVSLSLGNLNKEFDVVVHNLANVGTVGYKRRCNSFSKALMEQMGDGGGSGGGVSKISFDFSQGSFVTTGRSLDMALCGKGFFVVETPDGPLYTRNGLFRLNENGQLVDSAGRIIAGEGGPITIPPTVSPSEINVSSDGNITGGGVTLGKFQLVDFKENENSLYSVGKNCFKAPKNVIPQESENLIVKQGFQESSNVQMVEELVNMIKVTRLYEANTKSIMAKKAASKSIIGVAMG